MPKLCGAPEALVVLLPQEDGESEDAPWNCAGKQSAWILGTDVRPGDSGTGIARAETASTPSFLPLFEYAFIRERRLPARAHPARPELGGEDSGTGNAGSTGPETPMGNENDGGNAESWICCCWSG